MVISFASELIWGVIIECVFPRRLSVSLSDPAMLAFPGAVQDDSVKDTITVCVERWKVICILMKAKDVSINFH